MTNQEREEFELVAKACGYKDVRFDGFQFVRVIGRNEDLGCDVMVQWNPLTDDGDAQRLAVKLEIDLQHNHGSVIAIYTRNDSVRVGLPSHTEVGGDEYQDRLTATRLAIWRAAVEYAKGLK